MFWKKNPSEKLRYSNIVMMLKLYWSQCLKSGNDMVMEFFLEKGTAGLPDLTESPRQPGLAFLIVS